MQPQEFTVAYHGPAISDNTISAAVLGESFVALSDLLEASHASIYSHVPGHELRVQATRHGSFQVTFELAVNVDLESMLLAVGTTAALVQLLFGQKGSVLDLIRFLKGRKPDEVTTTDGVTTVRVVNESKEVSREIWKLYSSKRVTRTYSKFIQPLNRNAITKIVVDSPQMPKKSMITPKDRMLVDRSVDQDPVLDQQTTMKLRIETVRWRTARWEFSTPATGIFWAEIRDQDFLRRVDNRVEQMAKGDWLNAVVRVRQWDDGAGDRRTVYTIESVIDHKRGDGGTQLSIS